MKRDRSSLKMPRQSWTQSLALIALLMLGAVALVGPSGVLAWSENARLLDQREKELTDLTIERDRIKNRVDLLDPRHADPHAALYDGQQAAPTQMPARQRIPARPG